MTAGDAAQGRRHPDIFTESEALIYLGIAEGSPRTLETLRREHRLPIVRIGHATLYHRVHLDALVARLAGIDLRGPIPRSGKMKLA